MKNKFFNSGSSPDVVCSRGNGSKNTISIKSRRDGVPKVSESRTDSRVENKLIGNGER